MKFRSIFLVMVAVSAALGGILAAGCAKEEEPVNAAPAPGAGKAPAGGDMGTAQPARATGPDGNPP